MHVSRARNAYHPHFCCTSSRPFLIRWALYDKLSSSAVEEASYVDLKRCSWVVCHMNVNHTCNRTDHQSNLHSQQLHTKGIKWFNMRIAVISIQNNLITVYTINKKNTKYNYQDLYVKQFNQFGHQLKEEIQSFLRMVEIWNLVNMMQSYNVIKSTYRKFINFIREIIIVTTFGCKIPCNLKNWTILVSIKRREW